MNLDNELALAHRLADAAGDILRRYFGMPLHVESKADKSPVTAADLEAETVMRGMIEAAFPGHGIIGEEFANVRENAVYQWILDPIDGTRAFIAGEPTFTALIALCENGRPVLGIIDQPVTKERWAGVTPPPIGGRLGGGHVGSDAELLASASPESAPTLTLPLRGREFLQGEELIISTTSKHYFTAEEAAAFARLSATCTETHWGGDAYAYGLLASGKRDVVADAGMKPHDFCALAPVLESAGGVITDWEGAPLTLASPGRVLAARDPMLHAAALRILKQS